MNTAVAEWLEDDEVIAYVALLNLHPPAVEAAETIAAAIADYQTIAALREGLAAEGAL